MSWKLAGSITSTALAFGVFYLMIGEGWVTAFFVVLIAGSTVANRVQCRDLLKSNDQLHAAILKLERSDVDVGSWH